METLQVNRKQIEKLSIVLNNSRIKIFEYLVDEDTLVVYNNKFHIEKTIAGYMGLYRQQKQDSSRRPRKDKADL